MEFCRVAHTRNYFTHTKLNWMRLRLRRCLKSSSVGWITHMRHVNVFACVRKSFELMPNWKVKWRSVANAEESRLTFSNEWKWNEPQNEWKPIQIITHKNGVHFISAERCFTIGSLSKSVVISSERRLRISIYNLFSAHRRNSKCERWTSVNCGMGAARNGRNCRDTPEYNGDDDDDDNTRSIEKRRQRR